MMMKNTGRDREREASAWVEMRPAKYVSTTLYMVLKKYPMLAGTAIRRTRSGMGSVVNGLCCGIRLRFSGDRSPIAR
jgi:hypothetical protein